MVADYDTLLGHLEHHDVKGWLLRGCEDEDANTIKEAVKRIPPRRLLRRLARALTQDD
jgi:hypothetical protein